MSEIEQTKMELKEVLAKIPASGSFESAILATQASKLAVKYAELVSKSSPEVRWKPIAFGLAPEPAHPSDKEKAAT